MSKTVAVIGASNDRQKFGNKAVRAFRARGYTVVPIHPREKSVEGLAAYTSVAEFPGPIDMATVYVPASAALGVIPEIVRKGIREVWLNPGADDEAVVLAVRAQGLEPIVACSILGIGERPEEY